MEPPRYDPCFSFSDHPLRAALSAEMHGRKLPSFSAPARAMQVITALPEEAVEAEREALRALLPECAKLAGPFRYARARLGEAYFIWERHTEFSSTMLIRPMTGGLPFESTFDPAHFAMVPRDWFTRAGGRIVRAVQLAIVPDSAPDRIANLVERYFAAEDLVHCDLMDGLASLWADFRLNDDSFGRLLVIDKGMTPPESAQCIQRVQELGNYRKLALLGLPVAQGLGPHLGELERRLAEASQHIAESAFTDEALLTTLTGLAADIARIAAETDYRMSASRAYAEMVEDRLRSLRVTRLPGYQTLGDFTERRLNPAVRTCVSFSARLDKLARRAGETGALLRTRVDTELSLQNRDLLQSMNRRTELQLQLQRTVEGLSVVAISYYAVGLIGHLVEAADFGAALSRERLTALSVPAVLAIVWLGMRRIHRRLGGESV